VLVDLSGGPEAERASLLWGAGVAGKRDAIGRQFNAVNDQIRKR